MGGASQSTVNAFHYATGQKAKANNNEAYILNMARTISNNFKAEAGDIKLLNDSIYNLKASLAAYNKSKNETRKTMLLGEMWGSISRLEAAEGVQIAYNRLKNGAVEEQARAVSSILGRTVTVEDLKTNKNGVTEEAAIHFWAVEFMSESRATEIQSVIDDNKQHTITDSFSDEITAMPMGVGE